MKRVSFYMAVAVTVLLAGFIFSQNVTVTKVGEWGTGYYQSVFIRGNYAYCPAGENRGVDILDIADPSNPEKVANVPVPGFAADIDFVGRYAFVGCKAKNNGLQVVDIDTPSTPAIVKSVDTGGDAVGVTIIGNHVYAIMDNGAFKIFDITTPSAPVLAGSLGTAVGARGVFVKGNYAYVTFGSEGMDVIDVSVPAAPVLAGNYTLPDYYLERVWVKENYAYVTTGHNGLLILDVTVPSAPTPVGSIDTPGYAFELFLTGDFVFLADRSKGLRIIDVSAPSTPVLMGSHDTDGDARGVYITGNHAYIADNDYGLQIMDISEQSSPLPVGSYNNTCGETQTVYVSGNYAYVGDEAGVLHIVDISNPSAPFQTGLWDTESRVRDIHVREDYAYVANWTMYGEGVKIIDVSDPSAPSLVSATAPKIKAGSIYVRGNYAYISGSDMAVIDISDPTDAAVIGSFSFGSVASPDLSVEGNYAFTTGLRHGIKVFDISVPTAPAQIVYYSSTVSPIIGHDTAGGHAYLGEVWGGLTVLDISNPASPVNLGRCDLPDNSWNVYVDGNFAYVANGIAGLKVVDIFEPSQPSLVGSFDTPGRAMDVVVRGDYAYIADGESGKLFILYVDKSDVGPRISINKNQLNFAADTSGAVTGPQSIWVDHSGERPPAWSAITDRYWLACTPASGTGSGEIRISVDPSGLEPGTYTGAVSIASLDASNSPRIVSVTLTIYRREQTAEPFGVFTTPSENAVVTGSIPVTGWALDDIGVAGVQIFREEDGAPVYIGDAVLVEGARPDVEETYPGYPMNSRAGWGYMLLTNFLPNGNGTFTIYAVAADLDGHQVELGSKTIVVNNANAVKPFGAIDTPAQGGTASGGDYINYGWVLTPQPNIIPMDGSTIRVYVDGVELGNPAYNLYREDIAEFFPGYGNSGGAVGYFHLDTTQYENGVHIIHWTAEDDAGNSDGIGSRYFNVQNPVGSIEEGRGTRDEGRKRFSQFEMMPEEQENPRAVQEGSPRRGGAVQGGSTRRVVELERVEHYLTPDTRDLTLRSGYLAVSGQLRELPIGSTLDTDRGRFLWQPGPGFVGRYEFVFILTDVHGNEARKNVTVTIMPRY